jgi:hypothetical protein
MDMVVWLLWLLMPEHREDMDVLHHRRSSIHTLPIEWGHPSR